MMEPQTSYVRNFGFFANAKMSCIIVANAFGE